MYYVYVLKWLKKHYIGYTNNLQRRLSEHKRWDTITTTLLWTNTLIWYFEKENKEEAQRLEKIIKTDGHIQHWINHETFIKLDSD